jgi:TRAP-type C4-dicarboxylate transport system permease small subunit
MKTLYLGLIRAIGIVESALCYAGLVLCSLLVFAQVINRYILHYEIMWIGDLSLYIFVPMMILSIALTTRAGGHTSVDVFVDLAFARRPTAKSLYGIALDLVSLGILLYLFPMAYKLFRHALEFAEYGTLVRWFNTSWIRETVLVMVVLCIVHTVHRIGMKIVCLRAELLAGGRGGAQ